MLNISAAGNQNLLGRCPALKGYVMLIQYVREYQKTENSLSEAMDRAIDRCVKEDLLKEYLLKKKAEVKLMLLTEFDEELFAKTMKEEGREEGRKEGREEGENRLSQLYLKLVSEKRTQDLERVMKDKGFREHLYKRYGL